MIEAVIEKINSLQLPKDETYSLFHAASRASDVALSAFVETDFTQETPIAKLLRSVGLGYFNIDPYGWGFRACFLVCVLMSLSQSDVMGMLGCLVIYIGLNAVNELYKPRRKRLKELSIYKRAIKILSL